MSEDARFEDAPFSDRPLRLRAESAEDLQVISSLVQDAIGRAGDVKWLPRKRRVVILMNRFRWEDAEAAEKRRRPYERVRAALTLDGVLGVKARGISPGDPERIFDLLALAFEPEAEGAGRVVATFAGDATLSIEVECLEAALADLTRPWVAPSGKAPDHGD